VGPFFFGSPYIVSNGNSGSGYAAMQPGNEVTSYLSTDDLPPSTIFIPDPNAQPFIKTGEADEPGAAAGGQQTGPPTLLQLKDGYMYGLTDYWVEDGQLHYFTSYGAKNSVPIERVDLDKTVRLNWERGVEFVLRPTPSSH
jgi:hypothetical protein